MLLKTVCDFKCQDDKKYVIYDNMSLLAILWINGTTRWPYSQYQFEVNKIIVQNQSRPSMA